MLVSIGMIDVLLITLLFILLNRLTMLVKSFEIWFKDMVRFEMPDNFYMENKFCIFVAFPASSIPAWKRYNWV